MSKEIEQLHDAMCCNECKCPIGDMLEQNAAQFAYRASNVNAVAMEQFQQNVAAQNALLLQIQASVMHRQTPPA